MSLLKPAVNQTAYLKAGFLGFQGSGKTRTASELMLGLSAEYGGGKPVAFFDTETGSDFMIPMFAARGVPLLVLKSRSFKDLVDVVDEAEKECYGLIVDSVSHVWTELMESYKRKLNRRAGLQFQDWAEVKGVWRQFTDRFINSQLHMVVCGRAAWVYEEGRDEETGKKTITKTGTKMRAETEFGYEPSLLVEMERVQRDDGTMVHRATVIKDRNLLLDAAGGIRSLMDGAQIDDPSYETWRPIIDRLCLGTPHVGVDSSRTSDDMIEAPDYSGMRSKERREVLVEEIEATFVLHDLSARTAEGRKRIAELMMRHFETPSWKALTMLHADRLQQGLISLTNELEPPAAGPEPFAREAPGKAALDVVEALKAEAPAVEAPSAQPEAPQAAEPPARKPRKKAAPEQGTLVDDGAPAGRTTPF